MTASLAVSMPAQRLVRWTLAAFFAGATFAVSARIYPEFSLPMRLVFGATMVLYGVLAVVSFGLRPEDPRVRVFVAVAVFVALTFLFYPFPPPLPRTLPQALYVLLHTGVFMTMSALLLHVSALLPEESPVVRRHPGIVYATWGLAAVLTVVGAFVYANAEHRFVAVLPETLQGAKLVVRWMVLAFYAYATIGGSLLVAHSGYRARSLAAKRQAIAVCAGLLPYGLLRLSAALQPRLMALPLYDTIETLVIFLLPLGFFVAIHGFQLFEGKVRLRRGILLTVTLALLMSAVYLIVVSFAMVFPSAARSVWGFTLLCLALGVLLRPGLSHVSTLIDTVFFPERLVVRRLTAEILKSVAEYTDISVLCKAFAGSVAESLALTLAGVYVVSEDGRSFDLAGSAGAERIEPLSVPAEHADGRRFGPFVHAQPIAFGARTNALLCLGPPVSGERLSAADLRELAAASLHVSAMIENARLFALATRDALTGLHRRTVFEEQLATEIARFRRAQPAFAVLLVDLDDFKHVNDTHGHPAGDVVLRGVATAVRGTVRETDTVARYGGEELILLLPATTGTAAAQAGEKLRAAIAGLAIDIGTQLLSVTVSVGCAVAREGEEPAQVVANADAALYAAKRAGKNRVELHRAD
jgi:diguanylate cyclase (GGDEF)-like protein